MTEAPLDRRWHFADKLEKMFPLPDGQRLVSVELCFHPNETVYANLKIRVNLKTVEKMLEWFPYDAGEFGK